MGNNYPIFDTIEIRREYSNKIHSIFEKENFDWDICPAASDFNIFVKPNIYMKNPPLNTEYCPFKDVAKIGVSIKEGTAYLGIIAYPTMSDSKQEKILKTKGYVREKIKEQPNLYLLTKPLNSLKFLVKELKNIESVLLKKRLK